MRVTLPIVTEVDYARAIVLVVTQAPLVSGQGGLDALCGGCGVILVQGVYQRWKEGLARRGSRELILRCPVCGSYVQA